MRATVARAAGALRRRGSLLVLAALALLLVAGTARAADWTVTVRLHAADSLTDDAADGPDDIYWKVAITPPPGQGNAVDCSREDDHEDDDNTITPNWACTTTVTGGGDPLVDVVLQLWDHDTTSGDDEFDVHDDPAQLGLPIAFRPASSFISIANQPGFATPRCAPGRIRTEGRNGDDRAAIVFSVTSSLAGAPDGDSDGDGLPDSWERCGVDGDGDGQVDVNLPALGADPFRKDLFVEADWMVRPTVGGVAGHSHEPWLPALVRAWNEMNIAPVTNPTVDGVAKPNGIALHVDTGTLYANTGVDFDGDGVNELPPPLVPGGPSRALGPDGNLDLSGDGVPDIGDLGALSGTAGGNRLPERAVLEPVSDGAVPPTFDVFGPGTTFRNIKDNNFAEARESVFHYAVFGHLFRDGCAVPNPTAACLAAAPSGNSGLGEMCGTPPCDDFMVTLGGPGFTGRQTVDADRDGVPDVAPPGGPAPATIDGPSGLPVDGAFADHAGTFLHELGHNLGLDHGGDGPVNWKPNYLSVMNYFWQTGGLAFDFDGDRVADPVGADFDGDGIQDVRRFAYSGQDLPDLNEGVPPGPFLDETTGVGAPAGALTAYTCGAPPPPSLFGPPSVLPARGDRAIDWTCATPGQANVTADVNNVGNASLGLERLTGFDDMARLQNGGLDVNAADAAPGITGDERRQLLSTTRRIVEAPRELGLENRCPAPRRIDFEDQNEGAVIEGQYAPLAAFLLDDRRTPEVLGPAGRNGVPTASGRHSLVNRNRREGVPLVATFDPPQRAVGLSFGQAGLARGPQERVRAILRAFDQNDLFMGALEKPLPPSGFGVTAFMGVLAAFPDQPIRRVELSYAFGNPGETLPTPEPLDEPVQIDDLILCDRLREVEPPPAPPPPRFGGRPVRLGIVSVMQFETPGTGTEPGHTARTPFPFTGLAVTVDGAGATTNAALVRPEGTTVTVEAPPATGPRRFLRWRLGNVAFGEGVRTIPLTLLREGVLTAVYEGRELR